MSRRSNNNIESNQGEDRDRNRSYTHEDLKQDRSTDDAVEQQLRSHARKTDSTTSGGIDDTVERTRASATTKKSQQQKKSANQKSSSSSSDSTSSSSGSSDDDQTNQDHQRSGTTKKSQQKHDRSGGLDDDGHGGALSQQHRSQTTKRSGQVKLSGREGQDTTDQTHTDGSIGSGTVESHISNQQDSQRSSATRSGHVSTTQDNASDTTNAVNRGARREDLERLSGPISQPQDQGTTPDTDTGANVRSQPTRSGSRRNEGEDIS